MKALLLPAAFLAVSGSLPLQAALAAYEGFDYPAGTQTNANGGSGFSSSWSSIPITSPGMTYSDLEVTGNKFTGVAYDNTRNLSTSFGGTTETLWVSFIGRLTGPDSGSQGGILSLTNSSFSTGVSVGSDWWSQTSWGIYAGSGASTSTGLTNATFLLVRIDFKAGNEDVYLWTNPDLDTEPTTGTANATLLAVSDFTVDRVRIRAFNGETFDVDEIRAGTTFADVTPQIVPEPVALAMVSAGGLLLLLRRRAV